MRSELLSFFFFNDTATTEIYTLSLHDALPISRRSSQNPARTRTAGPPSRRPARRAQAPSRSSYSRSTTAVTPRADRKSTRLNSSHANISYAVFCLKKKKKPTIQALTVVDYIDV